MKRLIIFALFLLAIPATIVIMVHFPLKFLIVIAILLLATGCYDLLQKKHAILRNFPLFGHIRFIFESIRPEIQQYFIATNQSGRPFNREIRSLVYQRAKKVTDTLPFGTQNDIHAHGYLSLRHSLTPTTIIPEEARILVGGRHCQQPYLASRLNISAMSFGALSANAILALNKGAKIGNFAHNTGEGGLSPYHLTHGGDIIWQLGTGLFGARNQHGRFDAEKFKEKAQHHTVKMIEIKLSQGAKPSHGGVLPHAKITDEIAKIRGIMQGQDCISPPCHPEFSTPEGLLNFTNQLRQLSGGKPIGFKLCIGKPSEFLSICKAMLKTNILPDFITIDGAEGGTGAAPLEFSDHLGATINEGLRFAHNALVGTNLRQEIKLIASGKIASGFDIAQKICIGADMCNSARAMMFAIGCIMSLQCNTNKCPTGVTTHNPLLTRGLVVEDKAARVANFHQGTIDSFLELVGAIGINHIDDLSPYHLFEQDQRAHAVCYQDKYEFITPGALLSNHLPSSFEKIWADASAEQF